MATSSTPYYSRNKIVEKDAVQRIIDQKVVEVDLYKVLVKTYGAMLPIKFDIGNLQEHKPLDFHFSDVYYIKYIKNSGQIQLQGLIYPYHFKMLLREYVWHQRINQEAKQRMRRNSRVLQRYDYIGLKQSRDLVKFKEDALILWEDVASFYPQFYVHAVSWIATRNKTTSESELWHNAMENAFKNCQGRRTLGVPIGEELIDQIMQGYMEWIVNDLGEKIELFLESQVSGDPNEYFFIICRSDNLEIYLDERAFPGSINKIVHHLRVIFTDTFGLYGLFLNHRKRKQGVFRQSGIDLLEKKYIQWVDTDGKLDYALDIIRKEVDQEHPDSDILFDYVLQKLTPQQILQVASQILLDGSIPEAHFLLFRRIANEQHFIAHYNTLKPLIEKWFINQDTYAFRAQPCLQLYWALNCAKIVGMDKPAIDCVDDAMLYCLLKHWDCEKPKVFVFPQWSDLFLEITKTK